MLEIKITNPQVAIAGRVLDKETEKAIAGAMVQIVEMPEKFQTQLSLKALQHGSQWSKMSDRLDRKLTASDGYFYFINLPAGDYKLAAFFQKRTSDSKKETTVRVASPLEGITPTTMTNIIL